jgi:phosphoglycolate phosphatase-like HAD superfamily hydrolase
MSDIKTLIFDFDGTLILSNDLKYNAYFEIFPDDTFHREMIVKVLKNCFESSRFTILEKILGALHADDYNSESIGEQLLKLADHYNAIVLEGAQKCSAMPGALKVLEILSPIYPLYLSSTTPEAELIEIIRYRGWEKYFKSIYGYPRDKAETVKMIIGMERVAPDNVLIVGDGDSDRLSAKNTGANFFHVTSQTNLIELMKIIEHYNE